MLDNRSRKEYLLEEIKRESVKLGISSVNGKASNHEAVSDFIKDIFKSDEVETIIGKFKCYSGPIR